MTAGFQYFVISPWSQLFTNKRNFGSIYHLYCDVGKNIESLSIDNDDHHHDVVPNIHYSADCQVYFCTDNNHEINILENKHKSYIENNKKYIESQGYQINSKKLTTGRIELAKLETDLTENELMEKISLYDNIQEFFIT